MAYDLLRALFLFDLLHVRSWPHSRTEKHGAGAAWTLLACTVSQRPAARSEPRSGYGVCALLGDFMQDDVFEIIVFMIHSFSFVVILFSAEKE